VDYKIGDRIMVMSTKRVGAITREAYNYFNDDVTDWIVEVKLDDDVYDRNRTVIAFPRELILINRLKKDKGGFSRWMTKIDA
jgi:hypothetical protein